MDEKLVCSRCGSVITPDDGIGNGFAHYEGAVICYTCCADIAAEYMRDHGKITLYLKDMEVINWPGTLRFPVRRYRDGGHNMAGVRRDVWFEFEGKIWHGVQYGSETELCHCERTKKEVV